jgi:mitochondrial protein MBA1
MFANFAAGDMKGTGKKLCTGILNSLQRRIEERPPNTSYLWKLHKYLSPPALVSYKAHPFPETLKWPKKERHGVAQAVVRIHSLQSIKPVKRVRVNERGKMVYKEMVVDARGNEHLRERMTESAIVENAKETVEYVVLQQMYKMAEPEEWKVWGTTEETTLEKVEALQARRANARKSKSVEKALAGEGGKAKAVA